jgi:hypothetical protein
MVKPPPPEADLADPPPGLIYRWYADEYGLSSKEAARRLLVSDEVEDLMESLQAGLGDRYETGWLEHEPQFRFAVRVRMGTSVDDVCPLVEEWPLTVVVVQGAKHTYDDLESAMDVVSDMVAEHGIEYGIALDASGNQLVLLGPLPPSAAVMKELSEAAAVPISWEFEMSGAWYALQRR